MILISVKPLPNPRIIPSLPRLLPPDVVWGDCPSQLLSQKPKIGR